MGLVLRDGVYQVRSFLGEQIANYWYTTDLIYHLNWAAQDMCSEAQCLETIHKLTYPSGAQEVVLPSHLDKVLAVGVYSGQFFQLEAADDWTDVQVANKASGIPQLFYTKVGTDYMSPLGGNSASNATADITPIQITQAPNTTGDYTVLGLWPQPITNTPVSVWATRFHPWVTQPMSPILIPSRFAQGWYAYGVAMGKRKESMYDEADYWEGIYQRERKAFVDYWIQRKQLKTVPSYGGSAWPTLARGSSSVIFVDQSPGIS